MKATEILMAEHRIIEGVLDALDEGAKRLDTGAHVPNDFFLGAAEFIRGFADDCHHRKEEGVLFKALVRHGFPEHEGPVGMMLAEHAEGRRLTQELLAAALRLQEGDPGAAATIARNARAYAALMRQHIQKEDRVLYVMAEQAIPPDEQDGMAVEFERVEREEAGRGVHEKFMALAAYLGRAMGT